MTPIVRLPVALFGAYLIGGISAGWLLVRLSGRGDLRSVGSGVTGATNAGRVLGDRGFLAVLVLDAAAGARWFLPGEPWWALAYPAAVAGHIWPVWLRFRGGRGAAPLLGGLLVLKPLLALASVAPGLAILAATRNRFLAGATAFAASLILVWWLIPGAATRTSYLLACALVLLAHRGYLRKPPPSLHGAEHGIQDSRNRG